MKIVTDYIEYLKDNPEGYWFKRKLYGYGWIPAKPVGWIIAGVYLVFLLGAGWYAETTSFSDVVPITFIALVAGVTILLLVIIWRTGEPLKWQWGKKEPKS
jgi:hypothetical protein